MTVRHLPSGLLRAALFFGTSGLLFGPGCSGEGHGPSIPGTMSPEIRKQIKKLQSPDPMDRVQGARNLARLKSKAAPAIPYLIELQADNRSAQTSLDWLWGQVSLGGTGTPVDLEAGQALVAIGFPSVNPLIEALKAPHPRIRHRAAALLGDLAAGGIQASEAVPPLMVALHDPDEMVRMWSARSLGNFGDISAVAPLITCLTDSSPLVRGDAATSLANLGDLRAVGPLIDMLKRNEPNSGFAEMALRTLTREDLGPDYRRWQDWWNRKTGKE